MSLIRWWWTFSFILLTTLSAHASVVSGTFTATINNGSNFSSYTTDTYGFFGTPGASLNGLSVTVSYSYETNDYTPTSYLCGTNCISYQSGFYTSSAFFSVTINGVTQTYASPFVSGLQFQNTFTGFPYQSFGLSIVDEEGNEDQFSVYTSAPVSLGTPFTLASGPVVTSLLRLGPENSPELLTFNFTPTQANVVSGTFSATIGNGPTIDTNGLFGTPGADLNGDLVSVSYSYDTNDYPTSYPCQTTCIYYPSNGHSSAVFSITLNGITETFNSTYGSSVTFESYFSGFPPQAVGSFGLLVQTPDGSYDAFSVYTAAPVSLGTTFTLAPGQEATSVITFGTGPSQELLAFFSTPSCAAIINGSVPRPVLNDPRTINLTFTPNFRFTLFQAAQSCGFDGFDWQQTVKFLPPPNPQCENPDPLLSSLFPINPEPFCGQTTLSQPPYPLHLQTPYNDPPRNGYIYQNKYPWSLNRNAYPFYYPASTVIDDEQNPSSSSKLCVQFERLQDGTIGACQLQDVDTTGTTLNFFDAPSDPCFFGGAFVGTAGCGYTGAFSPQSFAAFTTHLAGINSDGTAHDLGIGWDWIDTYNGPGGAGGIIPGNSPVPVDPGGTGGIVIKTGNEITSYVPPAANAVPSPSAALLDGSRLSITTSGLSYSRSTQMFVGTLTITNLSTAPISGPLQISFNSLTSGVTLVNATGNFGGFPYITLENANSLASSQSITVSVEFRNPVSTLISFFPIAYTGSFN